MVYVTVKGEGLVDQGDAVPQLVHVSVAIVVVPPFTSVAVVVSTVLPLIAILPLATC